MKNYMYLVLLVLLIDICLLIYYTVFAYLSVMFAVSDVRGFCTCETREYTNTGYCKQYDTCNPADPRSMTFAEVFSLIRTHLMVLLYLLLLVGIILESQKIYLAYMISFGVMLLCLVVKIVLFFSTFSNPDIDAVLFPGTHFDMIGVYIKIVFFFAEIFVFIVVFFIYRELQRNKNLLFTLTAQHPDEDVGLELNSDIGSRAEVDVGGFLPIDPSEKSKKKKGKGKKAK